MNSSRCRNLLHFPSIVGFSNKELQELIMFLDKHYDEWVIVKNDKKTGLPKAYSDGTIKKRYIRPSLNKLKILQGRIKNNILEKIQLPKNSVNNNDIIKKLDYFGIKLEVSFNTFDMICARK